MNDEPTSPAEFDAELEECRSHLNMSRSVRELEERERAEQAEAELAALKARRCEGCRRQRHCRSSIEYGGVVVSHRVSFCSEWEARP